MVKNEDNSDGGEIWGLGMLNVFVSENLNGDYLFEIVLYIKMRIWHYVRFKKQENSFDLHDAWTIIFYFKNCRFQ